MPDTILKSPPPPGVATTRPRLFVLQANSQCPSGRPRHVWCTLVSGHHHRNDQGRSKDHGSKGIVQSLSFQRVICCFVGCLPESSAASSPRAPFLLWGSCEESRSVHAARPIPNLSAYVACGEARPAYKRAFEDQLAVFTGNAPPGC